VKPPRATLPVYRDWDEIKNEALDLIAECKREMPSWNYFVGGESKYGGDDAVTIILEYNRAS